MEKRDQEVWDNIQLPKVKNVSPRLLADDIFPYIPGDKENMAEWEKIFKTMHANIKEAFDEKGIPMPEVVIDHNKDPITYAIKTVDASGNTLHSQP